MRGTLPVNGAVGDVDDYRQRRRYALDMHVLKSEPVIGELGIPVGWFGLLLCLRWVIVLRGDSPASGNIPTDKAGRRVCMRLSAAHTARGCGADPSAILPLLRIYSWGRWWNKGLVGSRMRDGDNSRGRVNCGDDGGRGPG